MYNKEIYTYKLVKGRRTYFFNIKISENNNLYLTISENKKTENSIERHNILVFEEDIEAFSDAFQKAFTKFEELKKPKQTESKAYSVEKIREIHK